MAAGELRRFSQRFGAAALADPQSRAYRQAALEWLSLSEDQWIERLLAEQRLLRLPLVRAGSLLAVGDDEATWRAMLIQG